MKTISWEIIIAGLIFTGISIYLIEQNSAPPKNTETAQNDSIRISIDGDQIKVIELKSLENLENLGNLKNLEKLESLRNLENLKNITNFLPAEVQSEFHKEIEEAIREFEDESLQVSVDAEKGIVKINKSMKAVRGNWNAVSPGIYTYVNEVDASELNEAAISLPFGSINIEGGSDNKAKCSVQASGQISSKEDLQSKIEILRSIENQKAIFKVRSLTRGMGRESNIHLRTNFTVPQNNGIEASTGAGHISSKDIHATQVYETKGGHIRLSEASGMITAKTSGGHISISNSKGEINLRSMGGHVRARDVNGTLVMKTSGGNLDAFNTTGSIDAKTNGGNIELRFRELTGNTTAETGAGSITIWLPENVNADVDLSGNSVEIDEAFNFSGNQSSANTTGSLGGGGPTINAKTSYGKVILKVRD